MNSWCFTLALCCIRALGQTLEVPPADYGSYGSYDSYGDDVGLTAASETPGVVHSSHSYGRYVADVGVPHSIHHRHTVVMGDLDPTVGMPHAMHDSHTVTVPDATYLRGPSEIGVPGTIHHRHAREAVYYADATAGQVVPSYGFSAESLSPSGSPGSGDEIYHDHQSHECQGHEEQLSACDDLPECEQCVPVDCMFTQWGEWGLHTLGGHDCLGLKTRHRAINVASNSCGLPCFGDNTETKESLSKECEIPPQDCVLSFWSEWSTCKNELDQSIRTRKVETPSQGAGEACMGALSETTHPHPCTLSEWQHWTTCSASCGPGRHTRLRKVVSEGHLNGDTCDDSLLETDTCRVAACPIRDCQISAWSQWSLCSQGVQRMRHRHVLQSPQGYGSICNVSLVETAGCSTKAQGEHCEVSDWSGWTTCDRTCHGGQTFRQRELLHDSSGCQDVKLKETAPCAEFPCFPHSHDCKLSQWTSWSTCSSTVGYGVSYRKREVESPAGPQGNRCVGVMKEIFPCSLAEPEAIDCLWGEWSQWSGCSCSCGGGSKRRSRAIAMSPQNGGQPCNPQDKEVIAECNTQKCSENCEDGYWSAWLDWSKCSATCSNGYRSCRRTLDVLPNACGSLPSGEHKEFELCDSMPSCAEDSDCMVSTWDPWSHCSCSCNGIRERNRHIAYARGQGQPCDNMPLKAIEHCNPIEGEKPPYGCNQRPSDCIIGDWTEWSDCLSTCGVGQQERKRDILQQAQAGGKACDGNLMVTQQCNLKPCVEEGTKDCHVGPWSMWGSCSHCGGQRWRHREITSLPNYKGHLCESYTLKEVSNCTSICHETHACAWSEWSHVQCPNQCGDSSTLRTRTLQRLPQGTLSVDRFFVGDQHTACFGSQINLTHCPSMPSCDGSCTPVDCTFNAWSDWTEPTCVGLCERQRVIAQMNNECGVPCRGPLLQTKHCHTTCGHAVDCKLSEWSTWSNCTNLTSAAIRGQRYRSRHIVSKPERGGFACSGDLLQTRACESEMPEPCTFSVWESWSICSARCGEGTQWRSRSIHQMSEDGGRQCHGNLHEIQACHVWHDDCDPHVKHDCELGEWHPWSPCDYEEKRERRRGILVAAQAGGKACEGSLLEIESCIEVTDCVVTEWTAWDSCSKSCGAGHTKRQRQISKFPGVGGKLCPEDLLQIKSCVLDPCHADDCRVSDWFEWGSCSAKCGGGHQSRTRVVANLRDPGGEGCYFSLAEDRACIEQQCEEACEWGDWQEWTECSKTCGGGTARRNRVLISIPTAGGKVCDDNSLSEVKPCGVDSCGALCIDGLWGPWEDWSQCSASCDGGEMFRHRDMIRMANDSGSPATGDSKETRFCNLHIPCEGSKDCSFGPWSSWQPCSSTCDGASSRQRAVSRFGSGSGSFCTGGLKEVAPCNPAFDEGMEDQCVKGPPVDCELTTWSEWTACSSSCGGGESKRSRALAQEAFNGGFGCQEPLEEVVECAREACHAVHLPVDCVLGDWHSWGACNACGGERSRRRQILIYAKNGGRPCPQADMAEVKACPHACDTQFTCSWASWEQWGKCSMSCGVGSQRKRVRHMVRLPSPAEYNQISQYGLSPSDYNALTNGYGHRDKAPHGAPLAQVHHSNLLEKYNRLARKSELLEGQHGQEVAVAFVAGSMSMLALLGLVARLSYGRFGRYESSQVRTSFLSRNSREELPQSDAEAPFMSQ